MKDYIQKLINIASEEVGYLEKNDDKNLDSKTQNAGNGNYTKYARDCFPELQGLAWCAMFVRWCFEKAFGQINSNLLIGLRSAKCSVIKQFMSKLGCEQVASPQAGDIVFFKSADEVNHIGLIYNTNNNQIYTIEGNTSTGDDQVIPNGGGVFKKSYRKDNWRIDSIYRPKWSVVDKNTNAPSSTLVENNNNNNNNINAEINAMNVNIRTGAGLEYPSLGRESKGFKFYLLKSVKDGSGTETWYELEYKGQKGYIRSDFVNKL